MSLFVGCGNVAVFIISVIAVVSLANGCCKCCAPSSSRDEGTHLF